MVGRVRRALVEDHHDVRAQGALHRHGLLRPHEDLGAVHRRGEGHALLLDLAHGSQAEHLETAGIGEDRAFPLHEVVQVAVALDHLGARAQPEMEGVAEDDLRADVLDVARQHALHRAVGAHRHEGRGLDHAAGEGQAAATGLAVGRQQARSS